MQQNSKVKLKVNAILLGPRCVGKTQLLNHLRQTPSTRYCPTIGVDFHLYKSTDVDIHIWDTAGGERFQHVVEAFLPSIDLCIFVYRTERSFRAMMQQLSDVKQKQYGKRYCIVSIDHHELGASTAEKYGFLHHPVNSYDSDECIRLFQDLAQFCQSEQRRVPWVKTITHSVKKPRESHCLYSFC